MKNIKRETDGRFALTLSTRKSVQRFEDREKQREAKRQQAYDNAIARGLTPAQAEDEVWLYAV